ncbi:XdhC family protein [Paenibacillus physcomitrellae]|uniref:XdhC/CoxI family protein n=1 Tax=Paenibacillus physcomitrellae TaxID=1619311 RepID=A0ABQ1FRA7_9BACL|nr:XdhC family protein [Paenibacillus physcomitrellae]GGA26641.1 hypothetical protein GCM10010917_09330 [Paenibacillus physcomitrellae]
MDEIVRILRACEEEKRSCVIAAIVDVDGSAYRREGARCIILQHGEVVGILSGGCIEEDLKEHAAEVFATGLPRRLYYDFRAGEDEVWGLGIGCNGAVGIWLELYDPVRFPAEAQRIADDYQRRLSSRHPYAAVTVLSSSDPLVHPVGGRWTASAEFSSEVGELREGQKAGLVKSVKDGVTLELLVESIRPAAELVIVGVGEDARLLSVMAKQLGWRVSILYHTTDKADRRLFPAADEVVIVPRLAYGQADAAGKFVVVMTHNLELDREAVRQLLKADPAYLGLVGSKYRLEQILSYIRKAEPEFEDRLLEKLYSPAGLDIGAETPQEIALSILAEAVACRSGKPGGFLRDRKGFGRRGLAQHVSAHEVELHAAEHPVAGLNEDAAKPAEESRNVSSESPKATRESPNASPNSPNASPNSPNASPNSPNASPNSPKASLKPSASRLQEPSHA